MNKNSYRKIIVGDNFANGIRYVKGASYQIGPKSYKISDIIVNQDNPDELDIYVVGDGGTIHWKTIDRKTILEREIDLNFK